MTDHAKKISELKELSETLLKVHKILLNFQTETYETLHAKKLTVYEVFNLTLQHPDFQWLRSLSKIAVEIDGGVAKAKTDLTALDAHVKAELRDLFMSEGKELDFKNKIQMASEKNRGLLPALTDLKNRIAYVH